MKDPKKYEEKVKQYVTQSAKRYEERCRAKEEERMAASVSTNTDTDAMAPASSGTAEFELGGDDCSLDLEFEEDEN